MKVELKIDGDWVSVCDNFLSLEYQKAIDVAGNFSFEYALSGCDFDQFEHRMEIRITDSEDIFYGRITQWEKGFATNGPTMRVEGLEISDELNDRIIHPNTMYADRSVSSILNPGAFDTILKPSGWSYSLLSPEKYITYLASLSPCLFFLEVIGRQTGYHWRLGTTERRLEVGEFGQDSGVIACKNPKDGCQNEVWISSLTQNETSTDLYNRVFCVAGADDNGVNATTLRDLLPADTNPSYPVYSTTGLNTDQNYSNTSYQQPITSPNTNTLYFIQEPASIAEFGLAERAVSYKDIYPISSNAENFTDTDRHRAAKEMYNAAITDLKQNAQPQITYSVELGGDVSGVRVGDKIRVKFQGEIKKSCKTGERCVFADIDDSYYLVSKKRSFGTGGVSTSVEVSNKLKNLMSDADILMKTFVTVKTYEVQRHGSANMYMQTYRIGVDGTTNTRMEYIVPENMIHVNKFKLKFLTTKYRSYDDGGIEGIDTTPIVDPIVTIDGVNFTTTGNVKPSTTFDEYAPNAIDSEGFDILEAAMTIDPSGGVLNSILSKGSHKIEVNPASGKADITTNILIDFYLSAQ